MDKMNIDSMGVYLTNTTFSADISFQPDVNVITVAGNMVLSALCIATQLVIICVSVGLEGDFSARTLIGFQACCEILKRLASVHFASCLIHS